MNLYELQAEHMEWLERNFPNQQPHDPLLGLVEEVGELAHAHLKDSQSIRGTPDEHRVAILDAIGDIVIYLASYCNTNGYELDEAVVQTWHKVKLRDWRKFPQDGGELEEEDPDEDYRETLAKALLDEAASDVHKKDGRK